MAVQRATFWALVLPLGAATVVVSRKYAAQLSVIPSAQQISDTVITGLASSCSPEPQEQLQFILSITIPIVLAFVVTLALRALGAFRRDDPFSPLVTLLALLAQLSVAYVGCKGIDVQGSTVFGFRFLSHASMLGAILLVAVVLASTRLGSTPSWPIRALLARIAQISWLPWCLALAWIVTFGLTGIYRQGQLPYATHTLRYHLPYTMGEFAAALNGRIPLVDFYSQYENLQCLLVKPVFKLFGLSVGSFTLVMFGFTVWGPAMLYAVLCRICGSRWTALVLFAPYFALTYYAAEANPGAYISNIATYYASGPIRCFGICLLAWCASWYLTRPSWRRLALVAPVALLVALNNLDFGVPAALGVLGSLLLFPPPQYGWRLPVRIVAAGTAFMLAALSTLGLYCLVIRTLAGAWPSLGHLTVYQNAFAVLGCFMMPMPPIGMHWVSYLIAVAAVVVPIYETFSVEHDRITDNRRLINGNLAFAGLAAMGPMAYFVGRSYHQMYVATLYFCGFALVLFVYRNWQLWTDLSHRPRRADDFLLIVPLAWTLGLAAILFPTAVYEVPSVSQQIQRIMSNTQVDNPDAKLVALIKKYAQPNDKTAICYRDAHWLALQAGVNNIFPFAHTSLFVKDQVNAVMATLTRLPKDREYFFGSPITDLRPRLQDSGFVRIDGIGDFDVWFKERSP